MPLDQGDLAALLEQAVEAAGKVLNDGFEGEGILSAGIVLQVAVQPEHPAPDEGGWRCFVFGWMPQPQVLAALPDGEHVRTCLGQSLVRAGAKLSAAIVAEPPPDPGSN